MYSVCPGELPSGAPGSADSRATARNAKAPAGRGFRKRLQLSAGGLADQLLATDVRRNSSRTHSSIMRFS